jgi:hypothetical protein
MDRDLPQFCRHAQASRQGYNLRPPQVNNDSRTTMWTSNIRQSATTSSFRQQQREYPLVLPPAKPPLEMINEVPAHGWPNSSCTECWQVPAQTEDVDPHLRGLA